MTPIRRILCAVDFSECSNGAARTAIELARTTKASVTLLHAYGLPISAYPEGFLLPADVLARIGQDAQRAVESLAAQLRAPELDLRSLTEMGPPAEAIVERARAGDFDLIVIGTRGRTGLGHLLLGSVAERVVRFAHCPVLTVPARHDERRSP